MQHSQLLNTNSYLIKMPATIKTNNRASNHNTLQLLKIHKRYLINKIQKSQSSNSYLQYLLSSRKCETSIAQSQSSQKRHSDDIENSEKQLISQKNNLEVPQKIKEHKSSQKAQAQKIRGSHTPNKQIMRIKQSVASSKNLSNYIESSQFSNFKRKEAPKLPYIVKSENFKTKKQFLSQNEILHSKIRKQGSKTRRKINQSQSKLVENSMRHSDRILEDMIKRINKLSEKRSNKYIVEIKDYLTQKNQYFKQLPENITLCILKIGGYHRYAPGETIYRSKQDRTSVYILLEGVIHYLNPILNSKRLAFTGELFGQQMVLANIPALETVKSVTKCIILCLHKIDLEIIKKESIKLNFYKQYSVLQNSIKSSYEHKIQQHNSKIFSSDQNN